MTKYRSSNRIKRITEYSSSSTTIIPTPAISPFTQEPLDYEDNAVVETTWTSTWSNFQIIEHFPDQEETGAVLKGLGILGGLTKNHDSGNKRTVQQRQPYSKSSNKNSDQPMSDMSFRNRRD